METVSLQLIVYSTNGEKFGGRGRAMLFNYLFKLINKVLLKL